MTHRRSAILTCSLLAVVGLGLTACSSSVSRNGAATTEATVVDTTDAPETTTGGSTKTTAAATTTVPSTTTPPTTAKPPTTQPAGPTTKSVTAAKTTWTCAEASALPDKQITVSWTTSGAVSVIIGIDNPGEYATGPANGSYGVPGNCGDTQNVYITPVDSNGKKGTPKTLLITILA